VTFPEAVGPRYAAAPVKTKSPSSAPKARKKSDSQAEPAVADDLGEGASEHEGDAAAPGELRPGPLTALLGLLVVGLVVATYMTVAHLQLFHGTGSFKSICNFGAKLNCDAVNTSDQSEIRGVGIALFAVPAYAMLAFLVQRARSAKPEAARVAVALAHALAWPAVAYSAYLFFVMAFQLHTFCLFCLTLDTVNIAAVVLTAMAAREKPSTLLTRAWAALDGPGKQVTLIAGGIGGVVLAIALGGHAWLRASLEAEARASVMAAPASSAAAGEAEDPQAAADDLLGKVGARKLPTKRWPVPVDDDDASVGPKDAKVTIVQFADFQCSFCRKLEESMAALRKTYATQVRFVFKHFPMNTRCNPTVKNDKHSHACDAAAAGECARRQGKFWPMHDMLYDRQTHLERSSLDADAAEVGVDMAAFGACMDDATVTAAIAKDSTEGAGVRVNGTPRTFINGRMFSGVLSEDLLDFVVRIELGLVTGKEAESYAPKPAASP
jgi:protein-disulfide isomerase/uncharacterized membrane protein